MSGNLGKKALKNIATADLVTFTEEILNGKLLFLCSTRDSLPELVSNLTSNAIHKFERKISGKGALRGRGITLFILNEDMYE